MLYVFNKDEKLIALLKPDFSRSTAPAPSGCQAFLSSDFSAEFNREIIEGCPYWDSIHREVLNGENTFTFTVPADKADAACIQEGNLVAFRDLDSYFQFFEIKRIIDKHGDGLTRTAYCEHIFYELLDDIVTDKRPALDARSALEEVLTGTRWQAGIVDDLGQSRANVYYEPSLSAVQKIANAWKGEQNWRCVVEDGAVTRIVDLLAMRGVDTGKQFAYTKDILSIEREVDSSGVATALYGRGKGVETESGEGYGRRLTFADVEWSTAAGDPVDKPLGQEWVGDPGALAQWGRPGSRHRFDVFVDEDEEDPAVLLQKTWNELQKKKIPRVTYRLNVVSLEELTGYEHEQVRLGDLVRVIDREFKPELVISARVIELERDLLSPENTKIVLGSFAPTIVEATINNQHRLDELINKPYNTRWLDGVIDVLQNAIENRQACIFETPQGTLHLDAPTYEDATEAMLLGGGRFALADQKDGQGGWNWRTFGTGRGVIADLIVAGVLQGGKVRFNLSDGVLCMGEAEDPAFLWDGEKLTLDGVGIESYATKTYVETELDNIEIGGRNLLVRNNELENYWINAAGEVVETNYDYAVMHDYIPVEPGKTLTFSKTDSVIIDGGFWRWSWHDADKNFISRQADSSNEFQWVVPDGAHYIRVSYPMDAYPQIERGNKVTDWTPALEDIDNRISEAESAIVQNAEQISLKVNKTVTDEMQHVISEHSSAITQNADEIELKVSKNGVISAINQTAEAVKIQADKIDLIGAVTVLSDITGNLGSITAGTITGVTFQTAASGNRLVISGNVITGYQSGTKRLVIDYKGTNFYCPNGSLTGYLIGEYDTTYDLRTLKISTPSPKSYDLYANIVMESNEIDLRAYNNHWASTIKSSLLMDGVSATISLGQKTPLHAYYWGGVGINKYWERGGLDVSGDIYTDGTIKAEWGNINYYLHVGTILYVGSYLSIKNTKFDVDVNYNNVFRLSPEGSNWALRIGTSSAGCVWKALGGTTRAWQARNSDDSDYIPIYATDFVTTSKKEFKENIKPAESALKQVLGTPVYNFTMKGEKGDARARTGLVYEEAPETLRSIDGLSISDMVGMLWKAVQELNEKVEVKGGINLEN